MKKKTAILIAGALAAAGIMGLTACSDPADGLPKDEGLPKGEMVNEDGWKAAMSATMNAENYTVEVDNKISDTASGKVGDRTVTYVGNETMTSKLYYDYTGKKLLTELKDVIKVTGAELFGDEDEEKTIEKKGYLETDGLTIWRAGLSTGSAEWTARSTTYSSQVELEQELYASGIANMFTQKYSVTEGGESATFSELYSAFTYNDGLYTATLYLSDTKCEFTISISGGYVTGISNKNGDESTEDGIHFKSTYNITYKIGEFGKTVINAPEGAAAAIAAQKNTEKLIIYK